MGLMGVESHRAGRQHDSAEPSGPAGGIALDGEVERRLEAVRAGDGARRRFAVGRDPARREPRGRIVPERIGARQNCFAVTGDRTQHRIGERRERRARSVGPNSLDREIDRGVIGDVEKQDLRRADS